MEFLSKWMGSVEKRFLASGGRKETANDAETENDTETATRDESRSSLFYCPDCKTVYIATDKITCSACETTVDQVPSTFAETR